VTTSAEISLLARSYIADRARYMDMDVRDTGKPTVVVKPLVKEVDEILALLSYSPEKARDRLQDMRKTLHRFSSIQENK